MGTERTYVCNWQLLILNAYQMSINCYIKPILMVNIDDIGEKIECI